MDFSPPLAADYYLRNFERLTGHVRERYEDLLAPAERQWHDTWRAQDEDARRLYVRLTTRAGPAVPVEKLRYVEIPDRDAALRQLGAAGLVQQNPPKLDTAHWLQRLTRVQLAALAAPLAIPPAAANATKPVLLEHLLQQADDAALRTLLAARHPVVAPTGLENLLTFRLLFFGNLYQDLSEFIISELGHVNYERYPLARESRAFHDRRQVDELLACHALALELDETLADMDAAQVLAAAARIPPSRDGSRDGSRNDYRTDRRRDRLVNRLARQLERLQERDAALALYQHATLPPARERRCRLLAQLGHTGPAIALLDQVESNAYSEEEAVFAGRFRRRLRGERTPPLTPNRRDWTVAALAEGPEQAALACYRRLGYDGAHVENTFFNTVFGLLFWDICFLPLPDAFHHPFQRGPADLFEPDFVQRRREPVAARLRQVEADAGWLELVLARLAEKRGIANHFTNWQWPEETLLRQALAVIPGRHMAAILKRLLRDLRHNRSGLPDLLLLRGDSYLLVEVKGPGDTLQYNQLAWLQWFAQHEIPAEVARLSLAEPAVPTP